MLRIAVAVMALGLLIGGLVGRAAGVPVAMPLLIWGAVLLLAVVFERWRYRPDPSRVAGWQPTDERFIDPQSGQAMQVLYNPNSGERRYVPAPPAAAPRDPDHVLAPAPDPVPHVPVDPHSQSR
jgi:hypothetical protein